MYVSLLGDFLQLPRKATSSFCQWEKFLCRACYSRKPDRVELGIPCDTQCQSVWSMACESQYEEGPWLQKSILLFWCHKYNRDCGAFCLSLCLCFSFLLFTIQEAPRMWEHRDICTVLIYCCGRLPFWSWLGKEATSDPIKVWHIEDLLSPLRPGRWSLDRKHEARAPQV